MRYYEDENGNKVPVRKTHKFRNFVVLPAAGLFALVIAINVAHGGSSTPQPAASGGSAPAPAAAAAASDQSSHLEISGDNNGTAMLTIANGSGGTSTNTVQLPATQPLADGYVMVSVSRTPSVESFSGGGQGNSGSITCKIVRGGKVVDEKTATGQFAAVTCSKFA